MKDDISALILAHNFGGREPPPTYHLSEEEAAAVRERAKALAPLIEAVKLGQASPFQLPGRVWRDGRLAE